MCRTASHEKASPGTQKFKKHALVVTALVYRIRHSDEEEDDDDASDNDDDNDDDNDTTALSMLELFEQYTSVRFRLGSWVEADGCGDPFSEGPMPACTTIDRKAVGPRKKRQVHFLHQVTYLAFLQLRQGILKF